ncbi:hypothetical protein ACVIGB_006923 [Bradyrhizobium sp. USDA 4341]
MHTDNRGVDHLDSGIMGSRKRIYDTAPDTSPPQAVHLQGPSCTSGEDQSSNFMSLSNRNVTDAKPGLRR